MVIVLPSLSADDEAVLAAPHLLLDQAVAGRSAPGRDILRGSWIGCDELEERARPHEPDRLRRLDDRHRAGQPTRVDVAADLDNVHRIAPCRFQMKTTGPS